MSKCVSGVRSYWKWVHPAQPNTFQKISHAPRQQSPSKKNIKIFFATPCVPSATRWAVLASTMTVSEPGLTRFAGSALSLSQANKRPGWIWVELESLEPHPPIQHVFGVLLFVNLPSARATAAMAASSGRHKTLGHLRKRMPESWSVHSKRCSAFFDKVNHVTCVMTAQAKSTSEVHIIVKCSAVKEQLRLQSAVLPVEHPHPVQKNMSMCACLVKTAGYPGRQPRRRSKKPHHMRDTMRDIASSCMHHWAL